MARALTVGRGAVTLLLLLLAWSARPLGALSPQWSGGAINLGAGALAAVLVVALEGGLRRLDARTAAGGLLGGFLGAAVGAALAGVLSPAVAAFARIGFLWIGVTVGARALCALLPVPGREAGGQAPRMLLDTSALVDGRLPAIAEAGFLPARLVVPPFVLRELRGLADAADPGKRQRGRRGLDALQRLRLVVADDLVFSQDELPEIAEVDVKLAELARRTGARLLTQDVNLRKVAAARGVPTASLNDLARAFRASAQPGEIVRLAIVKEGREPSQGVGHLEDGTMVVVENGSELVGTEADVVLTNVVQTSGGRMFFARR